MKRVLAFLCGVCIAAAQAYADPKVDAVDRIIIPVSDLARAAGFYGALSFTPSDTTETRGITLRLGSETIDLIRHVGRPLPPHSRSNDRWFQHLAIVVSDIDRAYAIVLRGSATPISTGPQELPAWNPNAGGIRAVYFRDPDGHPLELIQFPRGKGDPRWQIDTGCFSALITVRSPCAIPTKALPSTAIGSGCASRVRARIGVSNRKGRRPCPARMSALPVCAPGAVRGRAAELPDAG
jgi:catechol 2,3-dioxygenase-like lactoylglutathione lyase family enzyme